MTLIKTGLSAALLTTAFSGYAQPATSLMADVFAGKDPKQPLDFVLRNNGIAGLAAELEIRANEVNILPLAAQTIADNIPANAATMRKTGNTFLHSAADIVAKDTGHIFGRCSLSTVTTAASVLKYITGGLFGEEAPTTVSCWTYLYRVSEYKPSGKIRVMTSDLK